mmetsp:Transcript_30386/g.92799  ORF Transcript_30386/g.92799 Transcript_30386/m.92799 type:complete len:293 (+) Transcript_30386:869-1747(+)|eukprot:scaffold145358_cov32-Tisochrysis_lutea.AAC.2
MCIRLSTPIGEGVARWRVAHGTATRTEGRVRYHQDVDIAHVARSTSIVQRCYAPAPIRPRRVGTMRKEELEHVGGVGVRTRQVENGLALNVPLKSRISVQQGSFDVGTCHKQLLREIKACREDSHPEWRVATPLLVARAVEAQMREKVGERLRLLDLAASAFEKAMRTRAEQAQEVEITLALRLMLTAADQFPNDATECRAVALISEASAPDGAHQPAAAHDAARQPGGDGGGGLNEDQRLGVRSKRIGEEFHAAPTSPHPRTQVADRLTVDVDPRTSEHKEVGAASDIIWN